MAKQANKRARIEASSGNVLADLGLSDSAELDTKVRLTVEINRLVDARRLSQIEAAAVLEIGQPKISALKNYKLDGFSVERLMSFLLALGQDLEIRITPRRSSRSAGRIVVSAS